VLNVFLCKLKKIMVNISKKYLVGLYLGLGNCVENGLIWELFRLTWRNKQEGNKNLKCCNEVLKRETKNSQFNCL
jgi:hypothetical protein